MSKYDYVRVIKLLEEILYVLEGDHLSPFVQLNRKDDSLRHQVISAIEVLRKEGR